MKRTTALFLLSVGCAPTTQPVPLGIAAPRSVDAAEMFSCGEGGKPDLETAKCLCQPPKIAETVGKTASCVEPPAAPVVARKAGSGAMVKIPGGTFQMGDTADAGSRPVHLVTVASFELDETEVTVAAYKLCVDDKVCTTVGPTEIEWLCNWGQPGRVNHPMNCISWEQSKVFCGWAGKRLPTEEEWEYAARKGSEGRRYPWGIGTPDRQLCWRKTTSLYGTCTVGAYASKDDPWGLKDMAGNVWEWTASGWSDDYRKSRGHDSHVTRGGAWSSNNAWEVRGSFRIPSANREIFLGVRCAG